MAAQLETIMVEAKEFKEQKKVLVTGGAGFLGSHLCERLLSKGDFVLCLDNFYTGKEENISHLEGNDSFQLLSHDITDEFDIEVDQIYNLACPASPAHYQLEPIKTTKTCVIGSLNVLEVAKKYNARVLQASTSEVYGDPDVHPQAETYWGRVNPIGVRSCYDEGKRCAEALFFDYCRQFDVDIKVARIFNTYGPKMLPDDGRVVSNFIVQALNGEDITIYGDGNQTRSFCYVSDMVDGLVALMNSGNEVRGPMNLGNPEEYSMNELAELILKLTGSDSNIIYKKLPEDDPRQRKPDIKNAQLALGWVPTVSVETGLGLTSAYFRALKGSGRGL